MRSDAKANRGAILDAARRVLSGDPRASVETIARAAGLSRRALYGHFADRDALVRDVVATGAMRFNALAHDADDVDARIALARLTGALWAAAAHVQAMAALALDDAHVRDTAMALRPLRARVAAIVARGRERGELRTDISARVLARLIEETGRALVSGLDPRAPRSPDAAVRAVLGVAGLSWRETDALLAAHPGILPTPSSHPHASAERDRAEVTSEPLTAPPTGPGASA